jgi:hypothetical protein
MDLPARSRRFRQITRRIVANKHRKVGELPIRSFAGKKEGLLRLCP